jgi:hypothetical protein
MPFVTDVEKMGPEMSDEWKRHKASGTDGD